MYSEFYGLSAVPFRLSPDSRFFFGSNEHNKAMAFLNYGIAQGEGFVIVTGEVGAGKTTLVEHLLATLDPAHYVAGRIVTTQLDSYDMLRMVAASFNIVHEGRDKATLLLELKQLFDSLRYHDKRALLIVDEAQSLTGEAVEELRMLSNLQTNGGNSFQVILLGQPEFRVLLSSRGFEQVRQRVAASCHLGPLDAADTRLYIEHRLRQVGWQDNPHITPEAFLEVYRQSGGIPRRINTLFSRLLLLGFLDQKTEFDAAMVTSVASELSSELGLPARPETSSEAPLVFNNLPDSSAGHRPLSPTASDHINPRLSQIEEKVERHERVIKRALDIATSRFIQEKP